MIFQAVRKEPKAFLQRQPDGKGGWICNLRGASNQFSIACPNWSPLTLSTMSTFQKARRMLIGCWSISLVATTNPMGAGKWRTSFNSGCASAM